jgi:hypothetical protein
MPFTVEEDDAVTNIMVVSASGATNVRFKYIVFRGKNDLTFLEYNNGASTIVGHANAAGTMSVGAVRYNPGSTVPAIEDFSSLGGATVTVNSAQVARNKPDFAAPNGGNNTLLGKDDNVIFGSPCLTSDEDNFPNFYGTSASAPHAGATAALLLQARYEFYRDTTIVITPTQFFKSANYKPANIRELLMTTALNLGSPEKAGSGAIRAEEAIKTFGNATPIINSVGVTTNPDGTINVIVGGEYLDPKSIIYIDGVKQTNTTVNTETGTATTIVQALAGNPLFQLYSPPKTDEFGNIITNGVDGGLSDPKYLIEGNKQTVTIEALPATKKFGEILPTYNAKITVYKNTEVNGVITTTSVIYNYPADLATNPGLLSTLGLTNLQILSTSASNQSRIGNYPITPVPTANTAVSDQFIYFTKNSLLTVTQMPIRIVAYQKKEANNPLVYGQPIRGISFLYIMDETKLGTEEQKKAFRLAVMLKHQLPINRNTFIGWKIISWDSITEDRSTTQLIS